MSQQDGGRTEPVSLDNFLDALLSILSRVDNQALLAWTGRQEIAVGRERASGEPGYQHGALIRLALHVGALEASCVKATERVPVRQGPGRSGHEKGAVGTRKVTA